MANEKQNRDQHAGDFMEVGKEVVPGMRLRCVCRGHNGTIGRIAWSPCGRFIASPSTDKTIRIWDANDGKCLGVRKGHTGSVLCADWSPSGAELATSASDGSVRVWGAIEGTERQVIENPTRAEYLTPVNSVSWSRDGAMLAICGGGKVGLVSCTGYTSRVLSGHGALVNDVRWSPKRDIVASASADNSVRLWNAATGTEMCTLRHPDYVRSLAWNENGTLLVSCSTDRVVRVWNVDRKQESLVLEGHTETVVSASFSADGRLVGSKSRDGTVRLWDLDTGASLFELKERTSLRLDAGLAFSPVSPAIATLGVEDTVVRIWELDYSLLFGKAATRGFVRYTSAKIVLVGESNVGKSCLAMRLAENRYPDDVEHGTTHGMRLWQLEAQDLHSSAEPPERQRRDVVLWDFGGQDEYQLVHQMFLRDTTLALVLIDPTRGQKARDEARDWNKRLEKHLGQRQAVKLLVGTRIDDDHKCGLINRGAIQVLCEECGFTGFYETSALNGRQIDEFRSALAHAIDWDNLTKTSRPELFQVIRDEIEQRRLRGEVVLLFHEFDQYLQTNEECEAFSLLQHEVALVSTADAGTDALRAVCSQMSLQGMIVQTKLTGGDDAIVLQLPVIERYAASLIVAARDNPRGVPALETSELGSPNISLPGMTGEDRVPRGQERIVLEAVVELMIEHGLCFRHEGLLVFPTLLKATEQAHADELPGSVSLYYDFSGAIDNVYASLISWLVIGQGFGRIRLWENRVEFEGVGQGTCGLRKVSRGGGFAHLDVYFHDATPTQTQTEFISFVHQHLRSAGIDVVEHFELICASKDCRYEFEREVVQNRMAKGETDVVCPQCETRIKLSEGFGPVQERERDERAERKSFALMTRVREDVPKIVASVKEQAFGRADDQYRTDRPIRVLHLSDLHFTSDIVPKTKLQWLNDDIRKGNWLDGGELDYVVISGDMTHQGSAEGFRRASEFVSLLVERFQLSAERFVLVPGNHDVQDLDDVYDWRLKVSEQEKKRAIQEGKLFGLPNAKYDERFKAFSDQFYHPLLQKPYPLDPARQGVAYIFPETKLQFLTLNSCWEIDQFHRTRASIHPDALARLISEADRQIDQAIVNTSVKPRDYLRIGIWHHPVADAGRGISNREFLGNLLKNRVRVCLTGDVHEMRRELIDYWHDNLMHVIGAGSFGAKGQDLSEGSPRLYNVLEIERDFSRVRIHTRQQPKPNGAWKGWKEWPMPGHEEAGLAYFDIDLTRKG